MNFAILISLLELQ